MSEVTELLEAALDTWAKLDVLRDDLVRAAVAAGVSKNRVATITGLARTTVIRIVHNGQTVGEP